MIPTDDKAVRRAIALMRLLMRYHRYRVVGLEHVPRTGACLLVSHHTLATYDGFLLGVAIYDHTGRLGRGLGDDRIFQTPLLGPLARGVGIVPATPQAAETLLAQGELVGVAPGGMWESLRPRNERYTVRWGQRRGFVRLALRTGAPMLLAACPDADRVYTVYKSRLTDWIYERAHLPLPIARGLGPTLLPRPVQLTHRLAPLLVPPPYDPAREEAQVEALFQEARDRMQALLKP